MSDDVTEIRAAASSKVQSAYIVSKSRRTNQTQTCLQWISTRQSSRRRTITAPRQGQGWVRGLLRLADERKTRRVRRTLE